MLTDCSAAICFTGQYQAKVLNRVVGIDVQIPLRHHGEAEMTMPRPRLQHVVHERQTGMDADLATLENQLKADLRLPRLPCH